MNERIICEFCNSEIFKILVDGMFDSAEIAVMKIALPLAGVMTFFMGILQVGEKAGAIQFLAKRIGPFFTRLFPEIPKDHPVHGQMIMNFSANLLGLDNAATPFGLKAMQSLQEVNPNKETASNSPSQSDVKDITIDTLSFSVAIRQITVLTALARN